MILTTANDVAGKTIVEYKGIAFGEAVSDFNAFAMKSKMSHQNFSDLRRQAFKQLQMQAESVGANAIIGIAVDLTMYGQGNVFPIIHVSGTAVVVE